MVSSSLVRAMSLASLLAFLACLVFAALSVMDGMNDPGYPIAALLCLAWSYLASVWSEGHRSPTRSRV